MSERRLTPKGHDERRVVRYVKWEEWRRERLRALAAYVLVCVAAAVGIALAIHSNDESITRTRQEGAHAVQQSCSSRAELRVTVAEAIDDLRRLAIEGAPRRERDVFLSHTQRPIDRLLSEAAGERVQAPPRTPLAVPLIDHVRAMAAVHCAREGARFLAGPSRF